MRNLSVTRDNVLVVYGESHTLLRKSLAMAVLLAGCSSLTPLAMAMAKNAVLEEVIVTARKQEENVQDIPVSVQTIGAQQMQEMNMTNLEELSFIMPNVTVSKSGADDNLFIRGIGSGVNLGFERSIGTYIDGIYMGRGKQSRAPFLDLQRVEVLKGHRQAPTVASTLLMLTLLIPPMFSSVIRTSTRPCRDAGGAGTHLIPDDTYRFARGEQVTFNTGQAVLDLVGGNDNHVGLSTVDDNNFFGKFPNIEPNSERDSQGQGQRRVGRWL